MEVIFLALSVLRSAVSCYQFDLQISYSPERAIECPQSEGFIYSAHDFNPHASALSAIDGEKTASKCTGVWMRGNLYGEFASHDYFRSGKACVISDHDELVIHLLKREAKQGCSWLRGYDLKLKSSQFCENSIPCDASYLSEPLDRDLVEADLKNSRYKILTSEHYLAYSEASKLVGPTYTSAKDSNPARNQILRDATESYILNHLFEALYA